MKRKLLIGATVVLILLAGFVYWALYIAYPKPQIASNVGHAAPDFTLPDQSGKPLTLSSLRGAPVVLIFYRGYW
jgi:cytochrome oxidase Cu insertion factor (SCO1/SenC/PrrC family)